MNPVFGARRRAEELHSMLEAAASPEGSSTARDRELLDVVTLLREAPLPAARPEFVADLRERIMLAAEGELAPAATAPAREPAVRRSPRERRIATAVGGFAIISATASMAVAAQTALPGDTLYPLKRAIENVHAGVQGDAEDKGGTMLDNASGRLAEVGELSRADDQDARVISETLQDFVEQAGRASDLLMADFASTGQEASIDQVRTFTADSLGELQRLERVIPTDARSSLIEAAQVVRRIEEQAMSLCPSCSDLPLTSMPTFAAQSIAPLLDGVLDATALVPDATEPAQQGGAGSSDDEEPAAQGDQATPPDEPEVAVPDPDPVVPAVPPVPPVAGSGGTKGTGGAGARAGRRVPAARTRSRT